MFDPQVYPVALTPNASDATHHRTVYVVRAGDGIEPMRKIRVVSFDAAQRGGYPILQQVYNASEADWHVRVVT